MERVFSFSPTPPRALSSPQTPASFLTCRLSPSRHPLSHARIQSFDPKLSPTGRPIRTQCPGFGGNSSSSPDSGENDSKAALDAFFLGKALAEAINERIASNVGEFLSIIGQWQAEQQKQVQDFQEEIIQKAKKEKEKAAAEALAAFGGVSASQGRPSAPAISPPLSETNDGDDGLLGDMLKG